MRRSAKWLLSTVLTVAMIASCLPVSSMAAYSPASEGSNPYGINVDVSGVPKQVQQTVASMIAQGEKPVSQKVNKTLAKTVEKACGISLESVKTCLALGLMTGTDGRVDTSRFNLTERQFNQVMAEMLPEYYLGGFEYQCEVTDGIVTAIYFTPASEDAQPASTALAPRGEEGDDPVIDDPETPETPETPDDTTYTADFNWKRSDVYVLAEEGEQSITVTDSEGNEIQAAVTLIYNAETKEVTFGPKTSIDYVVTSVTLTDSEGKVTTIDADDSNISYTTLYALGGYELPDRSMFGENADYASTVKQATFTYEDSEFTDKIDVTNNAMQLHWNQMLTFTRDYAKYFGVAGDFWTSKNTEQTPYGAFKTQLDSYPEDYMPDAVMDYYMENMTLSYMSDVSSYADLLDQKIADCMAQITESMTDVQKFLVIHDWLANNAQFDMGVLVKTMNEEGNPMPSQMTAFGALVSDAMGYDGCICLGYSAAYAVLVQHAFPEIYQNEDGTWKTAEQVGDNDIVDLVQIRFYVDLADISVAGANSGFGSSDEMFSSVHYFNAVKVTQEDGSSSWYYIDSAYDDISTEVMDQCRVETKGNISHKYFMISPTNMLDMFEDSMDYIDSLYDGVVFSRNLIQDEEGNYAYETETDKYGNAHVIWYRNDATNETTYDDDQYEATWFSGATSEITNDGTYWYYVTGPSYSYSSMMAMQEQMGGSGSGSSMSDLFSSDDPEYSDRLVRRPMNAADEPDEDSSSSSSSSGMGSMAEMMGMNIYDDPYAETLFHFGYGSVAPGDSEENGAYYDQIEINNTYYDMYPDLAHTMGLYDGVIYFNLGNKIYMMENVNGDLENVKVTQLKEYNDVYASSDGRDFTGMSFYMDDQSEDNAFHVFNRPIAAISIEDQVTYETQYYTDGDGNVIGQAIVRTGSTPTMTVSIATNYSESYKTDAGDSYQLEAVNYNVDYSKYTDDDPDDTTINRNEEFMWCANVVDTMPMDAMVAEVGSKDTVDVTVDAWCGQDGYVEARTATYGLSDGTNKITDADEDGETDDPTLHHHYIENTREGCYICVHCNDAYQQLSEDDENYEPLPEGATIGHTAEGATEVADLVWSEDGSTCTGTLLCAERHCDAAVGEQVTCDVTYKAKTFATDENNPGTKTCIASYNGNEVGTTEVPVAFLLGDVNGDGILDVSDLLSMARYFGGYSVSFNDNTADVTKDDSVDTSDLLTMARYFGGYIDTFD